MGYNNNIQFSDNIEKVIKNASKIALRFGSQLVGTEHILYGLAKEGSGVASKVLENQEVTPENIIDKIVELVGQEEPIEGTLGFTPRTKRVIEK